MRRRSVLATTGTAVLSLFGGCGFAFDRSGRESGALVIANDQDGARTVTVTVSEYRERPASDSRGIATPTGTPLARRTRTFDVPAGKEVIREGFISEPGTYYVTARTESGLRAAGWAGFYEGADSGVGGGIVYVHLQQNGSLTVSNPVDD